MMAQMIWKGKTTAFLPAATPENMLSSYSESHWSTAETLHDVLDFTVRKLAGGPESPCIFILDCAPTHISTSFIEMWKEKLPWIHLANVAPNHTPFSQPLDVAYNRPLKEAVRTRYMKYMAREVLAQDLVGTTPTVDTRLTSLRQPLTTWVSETLTALQDRDTIKGKAWRHLVTDGETDFWHTVEEARKRNASGTLFCSVQTGMVPELGEVPPAPGAPPVAAMEPDIWRTKGSLMWQGLWRWRRCHRPQHPQWRKAICKRHRASGDWRDRSC